MALADAQRLLWDLITAPEGVESALGSQGEPRRGESQAALDDVVRSTAALDATGRLEIYANAYYYRIEGVLEKAFPTLAGRLGPERFHDLITSYLLVFPPTRHSIRDVGHDLPDFLRNHEAAESFRRDAAWAADLAGLEIMRADVFDAQDFDPLTRESVALLQSDSFAELELRLGPAFRIQRFEHPVHEEADDDASRATGAFHLVVWRHDESVRTRLVDDSESQGLSAAEAGCRFEELCDLAATLEGDEAAPALAANWLGQWLSDGLLRSE